MGKCYIVYSENLDKPIDEWSTEGPNRFYFSQSYDSLQEEFYDPPLDACSIGMKTKKGGKTKSKKQKQETNTIDEPISYPPITERLKTLDVFAGCGGEKLDCLILFLFISTIIEQLLLLI